MRLNYSNLRLRKNILFYQYKRYKETMDNHKISRFIRAMMSGARASVAM